MQLLNKPLQQKGVLTPQSVLVLLQIIRPIRLFNNSLRRSNASPLLKLPTPLFILYPYNPYKYKSFGAGLKNRFAPDMTGDGSVKGHESAHLPAGHKHTPVCSQILLFCIIAVKQ